MIYAILILDLMFADCRSLKDKRSILKPLLHKLHGEFNVSAAEVDKNDLWNESIVGCALISNEKQFAEASLARIPDFIAKYFSDIDILKYSIQIL
jgi:uncharacterized protein YlxP (DUF503 family)